MNSTAMTTQPAQPIETVSAGGKKNDASSPDVPFSQVLSSEMAQNQNSRDAKQTADSGPDTEVEEATAESGPDSQATQYGTVAPEAMLALAMNPDMLKPAPAAATADTVLPEAVLALPITPDLLKQATATGAATDEAEAALGQPVFPGTRKGRSMAEMQSAVIADKARATQKPDPALAAKAAPPAASATAFAASLAAAKPADTHEAGEALPDFMSHPAMRAAEQASRAAVPTTYGTAAARLDPSVGTAAWGQALGEKIVWMAAGAQQTASLTLNPPDLGPLQIVLNVSNDQATASFFSAQPEVRQALESAFPKLKEMMNEAGIQLGQATVSSDTPRQNDSSERQTPRIAAPFSNVDEAVTGGQMNLPPTILRSGRGLVDTFA